MDDLHIFTCPRIQMTHDHSRAESKIEALMDEVERLTKDQSQVLPGVPAYRLAFQMLNDVSANMQALT